MLLNWNCALLFLNWILVIGSCFSFPLWWAAPSNWLVGIYSWWRGENRLRVTLEVSTKKASLSQKWWMWLMRWYAQVLRDTWQTSCISYYYMCRANQATIFVTVLQFCGLFLYVYACSFTDTWNKSLRPV